MSEAQKTGLARWAPVIAVIFALMGHLVYGARWTATMEQELKSRPTAIEVHQTFLTRVDYAANQAQLRHDFAGNHAQLRTELAEVKKSIFRMEDKIDRVLSK